MAFVWIMVGFVLVVGAWMLWPLVEVLTKGEKAGRHRGDV
jgi:hypothetical protein